MKNPSNFQDISATDFTQLVWNSFESTRFALQYIAIPKAACTTLKWWFAELENCSDDVHHHADSWETDPALLVHDVLPNLSVGMAKLNRTAYADHMHQKSFFRFSVVRNPYTRIFSAWQSKLLLQEPRDILHYNGPESTFRLDPSTVDQAKIAEAFEQFLKIVHTQDSPDNWSNPHWTPQTRLLYRDLIHYDQIIQVESLSVFMDTLVQYVEERGGKAPPLRRFNENIIPYSAEYLSEQSISLIQKMYASDFAQLGYDPDHIPLGRNLPTAAIQTALQGTSLVAGRNQRIAALHQLLDSERTEHSEIFRLYQGQQQSIQTLSTTILEQQRNIETLSTTLHQQNREAAWFKEQVLMMERSRSWKLTRPLRNLAAATRRRFRKQRTSPTENTPVSEQLLAAPTLSLPVVTSRKNTKPPLRSKIITPSSTGLRMLIVTPDIVGPIRNGGIGTAFSALAFFAARSGLRVTILYTLGQYSEHWSIADCIADYARGGVEFIPMVKPSGSPKIDAPWPRHNAYSVYAWLKNHDDDYDLIIFPEWHAEAYYAVLARHQGLMLQNTPIWINTHGPSVWSMEGNYQLPTDRDLVDLDFMEREVVRLADGIISPSAYLLEWMGEHHWRLPQQTRVVQNLMEDEEVCSSTNSSTQTRIDELVFFGRLEPRKGLLIFCDAISRLSGEMRQQLKQITFLGKSLPIDIFDSIGYIENKAQLWNIPIVIQTEYGREQALAYLCGQPSRLAVIASLVENLPYTVMECLHHQIRFVATNIGGIPEMIKAEEHERLLFFPRPQALKHLLDKAISEGITPAQRAQAPTHVEEQWQMFFAELGKKTSEPKSKRLDSLSSTPLVSICIPHHNSFNTLRHALDSVYGQSYKNYELIVVDDGSDDPQTVSALPALEIELAEHGGRLLRQENAYPGAARNKAAAAASGEYLLFMDDDNLAMPHEIETFLAVAQRTQADILTTVSAVFTGKTPPELPQHLWLPLGAATGAGVYRNVFGDTNSFWKSSAFATVGGFTEDYGIGHEDWEIFAKAVLKGLHLELVPEPLFWYRLTIGGVQTQGNMASYIARSVRPYLQNDPHGLGVLAAHAAWSSYLASTEGYAGPIIKKDSSFTRSLALIRRPDLRAKFRIAVRRHGLKSAVRKALHHLRSNSL